MKRLLHLANLIFLVILALEAALPGKSAGDAIYFYGLIAAIELVYILMLLLRKEPEARQAAGDIVTVVYILLLLWELLTSKFNVLDKFLFPAPGAVVSLLISEVPELLRGLMSSLHLLLAGYVLALITAIPLALVIGWRKRLYRAVTPFTKFLGPIPPIVYIPYAIALFPTFKLSSVFVIFIGAFWPIFINTMSGVINIDRRIVDSARALNVKERTMLKSVILPGALTSIISGANIGLVLSFILLTAAEMIGATSGLGWYVKYFSDFADYGRVIVGIIYIGIVVLLITFGFDKLEKLLLRWKR